MLRPGPLRAGCLLLLYALATAWALRHGVPDHLPGVALGSPVLLVLEQVAALVACPVIVGWLMVEAWHGRSPLLGLLPRRAPARQADVEDLRRQTSVELLSLSARVAELERRRDRRGQH